MNNNHIYLQYKRLERHYESSLQKKDEVSFLDLAHVLRIFTEMKSEIDNLASKKGIAFGFENIKPHPDVKKTLKGKKYTYLPLGSGVPTAGTEVKGIMQIEGKLTTEEFIKISKAGPPITQKTKLSFGQWMGATIYEIPSMDKVHSKIGISREIFIKRVANMLGASHPQETDKGKGIENKFDVHIKELHQIKLGNGYPATYFQLLEIAKNIIETVKPLFQAKRFPKPL